MWWAKIHHQSQILAPLRLRNQIDMHQHWLVEMAVAEIIRVEIVGTICKIWNHAASSILGLIYVILTVIGCFFPWRLIISTIPQLSCQFRKFIC